MPGSGQAPVIRFLPIAHRTAEGFMFNFHAVDPLVILFGYITQ